MNLGTTVIKTVNSSKPQLSRSATAESVVLTNEEYLSLSDYDSLASVNTHNTAVRYETPPSRRSRSRSSRTMSTIPRATDEQAVTMPFQSPVAIPQPLNVRFSKVNSVKEIPLDPSTRGPNDPSPPTPGVDDGPYIRFAIDQLTRDEELLGRGRQPSVTSTDLTDYRSDPILSDNGLGYYNGTIEESPEQPDEEDIPEKLPETPSQPLETLIAVEKPPFHFSDVGFVPIALRLFSLLATILVVLLMIAALIFCNVWSQNHHGLWDFIQGSYDGRYFVFQYVPQLLGIILIVWLFVIQAAVRRVIPFMKLSNEAHDQRVLQDISILPANYVLPDFSFFGNGEKVLGVCEVLFWFTNFTVPLLSCAFQTKAFTLQGRETWRWCSVQGVVWALVVLYALLVIALVLVLWRFMGFHSGLCWDPVSIADIIPMFQRANFLVDYDRAEISGSMKTHIPPRLLRLGYWKTTRSSNVFYGVAEEGGPLRRYSIDKKGFAEEAGGWPGTPPWDVEAQRYSNASSFVRNIHSPFVRYRWTPWFLRDSAIVAWIAAGIVLFLAFVIVSFVKQAVRRGFDPLLSTLPNGGAFSPSNFLYSFLPALLGMFLFLIWQPIDMFFRAAQPFASLSNPAGATAEKSLLLSYPSCVPLETTFLALTAKHYRVAWMSFMALLSGGIPVIAGGVFTSQFWPTNSQIRVTADMNAYYLLVVILALYTFSFLLIWPTRKRYLPHKIHTVADILSFVYQSGLLRDAAFRQPHSKADLVGRLVTMPQGEQLTGGARKAPRYAFGVYIGRDGREHLGIDRLQRPGSGEMLITSGTFKN